MIIQGKYLEEKRKKDEMKLNEMRKHVYESVFLQASQSP